MVKKDEILAASRKENKNRDLAELEVVRTAGSYAGRVGATVCCVVLVLAGALGRRMLYGPWIIYFCMMGTTWLVRAVKLKQKSDWVVAVMFLFLTALALVGFIARLLKVAA